MSLFQSHINYGILLCGSAFGSHLNRLRTLQRSALKCLYNSELTDNLNVEHKVLSLDNLFKFEILKLVYRFKRALLPSNLANLYRNSADVHHHNARQNAMDGLHQSRPRTIRTGMTFLHLGPRLWNALPAGIGSLVGLSRYTKHLKKYLLLR